MPHYVAKDKARNAEKLLNSSSNEPLPCINSKSILQCVSKNYVLEFVCGHVDGMMGFILSG